MKKIISLSAISPALLFFTFIGSIAANAQTTLSAGDIAIIGYNYDATPQEMAIVTLAPIASGTVIRITDYGYDENTIGFGAVSVANTAEGSIAWTTTSAIAAGTVIKFTIATSTTAPSGPVVAGLPGTVAITGWTNTSTTTSPAPAGGDNWFIFQGTDATTVTTFVFAWTNPFASSFNTFNQPAGQFIVTGSGSPNNQNSYLPPSLTLGTSAIALNLNPSLPGGRHGDNNLYFGSQTGSKATILAAICNTANWSTNETTAYNLSVGGTNFPGSNPVFTISGTLPIRLLSFRALLQKDDVLLDWSTSDAVEFSHFEIERSYDGHLFSKISQQAANDLNGVVNYTLVDRDLATMAGNDGKLYYRLKMVDLDGSFIYSKVVQVSLISEINPTVMLTSSNPFTDKIKVNLNLLEKAPASFQLLDLSGRVTATKKTIVDKGLSVQLLEGLAHLRTGIYFLHIQVGNEKHIYKLVK